MDNLINCGQRLVQKTGRVAINDVLIRNDIDIGDTIEVFVKKVK